MSSHYMKTSDLNICPYNLKKHVLHLMHPMRYYEFLFHRKRSTPKLEAKDILIPENVKRSMKKKTHGKALYKVK